jgi:two-component sensor histidine kinase
VAALLRLQARRTNVPEAQTALAESVRRVSSIAVVHETLSGSLDESVSFDDIADRITAMVVEVSGRRGVSLQREGTFGVLPAEVATPLAMVLTELVQNAVEHGLDGSDAGGVVVSATRNADSLRMVVSDNGVGLPADFDLDGSRRLGLQIVRTLVETELGGRLELGAASPRGTQAAVDLRIASGTDPTR